MQTVEQRIRDCTEQAMDVFVGEYGMQPEHVQFADMLTLSVMYRLRDMGLRRELHMQGDDWKYTLAHEPVGAEPSDLDRMIDASLWSKYGADGILYLPRTELTERLAEEGMPPEVVALHSVRTIVRPHDIRPDHRMRED